MGFHDLLKQSKTRVWLWYVPLSLPYCFFSIWRLLRGEIRNLLFLLNCYRGNLEIEDPPIPFYSYKAKGRSDRNTNISSSFQLVSVIYLTLGSRGYVIAFNQSSFFGKRLFHFMTKARCSGYLWHDSVHAHNLQAPRNHLLPLNFLSLQILILHFRIVLTILTTPYWLFLPVLQKTRAPKSNTHWT